MRRENVLCEHVDTYRCPCGEEFTVTYIEDEVKHTCENCQSIWGIESFTVRRYESKFDKEFPKYVTGTQKMLNKRPFSDEVLAEIKRLEEKYGCVELENIEVKSWESNEFKKTHAFLHAHVTEYRGMHSHCELSFHYSTKMNQLNLYIESNDKNTDEEILENLKIFEEHINYYLEHGKLDKEYTEEHFSVNEVEEVVRVENWMY